MADAHRALAEVAGRRFGADLDALDPSRITLTSVETDEDPGIRVAVSDAVENLPNPHDPTRLYEHTCQNDII